MKTPEAGRHRQALFLAGMMILAASAGAYVWMQGPLRASIAQGRQLARNVGRIMTLDEVLTMSARMAASARAPSYEVRYNANVDELDRLIRETIGLTDDGEVVAAARSTDVANQRLVAMETRSFELDKGDRHTEALELLESAAYLADKTTYSAGMERAFSLLEHLTAARIKAVERWALVLQVVALLSLCALLGAWSLEQRARRRQTAGYAAELERTVALRTSELAERNRSMRLVLDTVQEGLIGIDAHGVMASERSAIVDRWFGPASERLGIVDYLRHHDPTFASWLELGLGELGEGVMPTELCMAQLPRRLCSGARSFTVDYESTVRDGKVQGLLLVISDITDDLVRARVEGEQLDLVRVLEALARDRIGFINFLEEASQLVADVVAGRSSPEITGRLVHTLKGNAAQFGLSTVTRVCHEIEDRMRDRGELEDADRALLEQTWRTFAARIREVCGESRNHLAIEKSDYDNVVQLVRRRRDHQDILAVLAGWELDPVQARFERLAEKARLLGERLNKPSLETECQAVGLRVDNRRWASFWSAYIHVVRNAVDHGIEMPEARSAAGKPPAGCILFSAACEADEFVVRIRDDGAGIDWEAVARKAAERGVAHGSHDELVEALFVDGVSTRNDASEVSGRGLGMGALRAEVTRRGGRIVIASERAKGTTIEIRFPVEAMGAASHDVAEVGSVPERMSA